MFHFPPPAPPPHEVIVVDGGSRDRTAHVAAQGGAKVVQAGPGEKNNRVYVVR